MWHEKTDYDLRVEEFKKQCETDDHDDLVFLKSERGFAESWKALVECTRSKLDFEPFENLIREGVEYYWGPCLFEFNHEKRKIFVRARDGRGMELVSGEFLPELTNNEERVI